MATERNERIRQRAYQIWEDHGRPEGQEQEHWEQASREIGGDVDGEIANGLEETSGAPVDDASVAALDENLSVLGEDGGADEPSSAAANASRKRPRRGA